MNGECDVGVEQHSEDEQRDEGEATEDIDEEEARQTAHHGIGNNVQR